MKALYIIIRIGSLHRYLRKYCTHVFCSLLALLPVLSANFALSGRSFPLGLYDPKTNKAFVATVSGIQALDIRKGTLLWRNEEGRWPLQVSDNVLLVVARTTGATGARIIRLNEENGHQLEGSSTILRLPQTIAESLVNSRVAPYATSVNPNTIEITWPEKESHRGGANPPQRYLLSVSSPITARIDLRTGDAEIISSSQQRNTSCQEGTEVIYVRALQARCGEWPIRGGTANLTYVDSGIALIVAKRESSSAFPVARSRTAQLCVDEDLRHVYVTETEDKGSPTTTIFLLPTGIRLAVLSAHIDCRNISVIDGLIVYAFPNGGKMTLTAMRIHSRERQWSVDLEPPTEPPRPFVLPK